MTVKTKIVRILPPDELTAPRPEPRMPAVPDRDLVLQDLVSWYEEWIAQWRTAFRQSEADKAAIRDWASD